MLMMHQKWPRVGRRLTDRLGQANNLRRNAMWVVRDQDNNAGAANGWVSRMDHEVYD